MSTKAFALGENGVALRSVDGGQSWAAADLLFASSYSFRSVRSASATFVLAVGIFTTIVPTCNGGFAWVTDLSQKHASLSAVAFAGSNVAVAVGSDGVIMREQY
jgi:photosystem II stability/assembly factor-like uncharacterized protein